ncbi:hypothetical protein ACHAWC_002683 [Mediolabrus comicus]
MYSFKKILNILIGIAAGVATADDTSSDASSVSLSLSLANVVPSNKAGKQTKAGKQVKAAVGKAVKTKAIKYDNSLSNSMSMSYGPEVDPDSVAAGLTFPVGRIGRALLAVISTDISVGYGVNVILTAYLEFLAVRVLGDARRLAIEQNESFITPSLITASLSNIPALRWLLSASDSGEQLETLLTEKSARSLAELPVTKEGIRLLNSHFDKLVVRVTTLAANQAKSDNTGKISIQNTQQAFVTSLTVLLSPGDNGSAVNELRQDTLTFVETTFVKWNAA